MTRLKTAVMGAMLALGLAASSEDCSSSAAPVCTPNSTTPCTGSNGCAGTETCNPAGSALELCTCPVVMTDAGTPDSSVADGASGDGVPPETMAGLIMKCMGTYMCMGGAMDATVTLMASGGMCTVTFGGMTADLFADGGVSVSGFPVGSWSLDPSTDDVTVMLSTFTNHCVPSP